MKYCALIISAFLALAVALIAIGCDKDCDEYRLVEGEAWGSAFHVRYCCDRNLDDSVEVVIRNVDMSISLKNPASVLSRFNAGEDDHIDSLVSICGFCAKEVNVLSGGLYDPTARRLIDLWRDYRTKPGTPRPTQAQIDAALKHIGISGCKVIGTQLAKTHPQMQLDFSSIIRGMGARQISMMLWRNGVRDYMVQVGDEVVARGLNLGDRVWHVPVVSTDSVGARYVPLTNCVASSCTNGKPLIESPALTVSTFVNPITGQLVSTPAARVTVVLRRNILRADALSTALMVMQPAEGLRLIDSLPDAEAYYVLSDGKVMRSAGWQQLRHNHGYPPGND